MPKENPLEKEVREDYVQPTPQEFEDRLELMDNEWQRKVPLLNLGRLVVDYQNGDSKLLSKMYSRAHEIKMKVWAVASSLAVALPIAYGLVKLVEK